MIPQIRIWVKSSDRRNASRQRLRVQKYNPLMTRASPHIHVEFQLVQARIEIHRDELMADWKLAANGQPLYKIEPLK